VCTCLNLITKSIVYTCQYIYNTARLSHLRAHSSDSYARSSSFSREISAIAVIRSNSDPIRRRGPVKAPSISVRVLTPTPL
jgi:hypothetical protein